MVLDDAGLSSFALGVASAAGAFLAISATVWIFIFDRRTLAESVAIGHVRDNANDLYVFLDGRVGNPENYLWDQHYYGDFVRVISEIMASTSSEDVLDYITWIEQTRNVTVRSEQVGIQLGQDLEDFLQGNRARVLNQAMAEFHAQFVAPMKSLDAAIQELDWASGIRGPGVRITKYLIGIASFLLVGSLVFGLLAKTRSGNGIDDDWNLLWGVLLITGIISMIFMLFWAFKINSMSQMAWIAKRIKDAQIG